jgi:hypothetical protein
VPGRPEHKEDEGDAGNDSAHDSSRPSEKNVAVVREFYGDELRETRDEFGLLPALRLLSGQVQTKQPNWAWHDGVVAGSEEF